ncbi:MAG TPA: cobalamin B12-binding domain-containing protein [Acidimicrobiales bacterium]|nr:cobalamin B12-binding domain-containing protein [Acidimicrobiales bacterium]
MPASSDTASGQIRIGELSRRVGVSSELLRAWERRYGLLSPARTEGGLRLYSEDDERRVVRMLEHLAAGVSAAEAARLTRRELEGGPDPSQDPEPPEAPAPAAGGEHLARALDQLDETAANAALDRLLSGFALETVVTEIVLPYLREIGERWQQVGDTVVAQEHFASALLRGRLLGLARGWGGGYGPMALLGCFPGEQHDLGLICFGLALRANGWRVTFLGPNTPFAAITEAARRVQPALIVLTTLTPLDRGAVEDELAAISAYAPVALAGAGMQEGDTPIGGAEFLAGDPFTAAARVAVEAATSGAGAVRRPATEPRRAGPA